MKSEKTLVTIVCDGCGAEQSGEVDSSWKRVAVTVSPVFVSGSGPRHREVDLCSRCLAQVRVPGIEGDDG
jgi:serine/threonine protein phosphatase PrpC